MADIRRAGGVLCAAGDTPVEHACVRGRAGIERVSTLDRIAVRPSAICVTSPFPNQLRTHVVRGGGLEPNADCRSGSRCPCRYEPIKALFEAVEEMVSLTMTNDATHVRNLVRTVAVMDRLADFVPVLKALHASNAVNVLEVWDGVANPADGWRDVTVWYVHPHPPYWSGVGGVGCAFHAVSTWWQPLPGSG